MLPRPTAALAVAALAAAVLTVPASAPAAAAPPAGDCPRPASVENDRVSGPDRIATAAAAALDGHDGRDVDTVVIASAADYPDATVGAVLAAALGAPLLLTAPDTLSPATADALETLDGGDRGRALVMGGRAAVRPAVTAALDADGWAVRRIAGDTRYTTAKVAAALLAAEAGGSDGPLVIASGGSWSDTAVGAAHAAGTGGQLALTRPDDATDLRALATGRDVTVIGGYGAVDATAYGQLSDVASSIRRIAGPDRAGTAVRVADERPDVAAVVATDTNWPDAIVGAAYAARRGATLLLTGALQLSGPVARELSGRDVTVVGGPAAVAPHVSADAADAARARAGAPNVALSPAGCTVVAATVGETVTLRLTADHGELTDVDVRVTGPADHGVVGAGGSAQITVYPHAAGTVRVAVTATASDDTGAARRVRAGWTVEAAAPKPTVVRAPEGWLVAAGNSDVAGTGGRTVRYTVEISDGLESRQDLAGFTRFVEQTLADPAHGWTSRGTVRLVRTDDPAAANVRVLLGAPATVDRLCARAGLRTGGIYSCWNGRFAAINGMRWFNGVSHVPDMQLYRRYVINHEVGHGLGNRHRSCPGRGRLAPVMMQLTKSTYGCVPNGVPYP